METEEPQKLESRVSHEDLQPLEQIVSRPNKEGHIMINGQKVPLGEVLLAYAGVARPGYYQAPTRNLPSAAPVGLIGFGVAAVLLGLVLVGTRDVAIANITCTTNWFVGGIGLLQAGMWEVMLENTFAACALSIYGLNWWVQGAITTPSFGLADNMAKFAADHIDSMPAEYADVEAWVSHMQLVIEGYWALGLTIFTVLIVLLLLKSTVAFLTCLSSVVFIFLLLCIGYEIPNTACLKAAGAFAIVGGMLAFYNAFAGVMTPENSYIRLSAIHLPGGVPIPDPEAESYMTKSQSRLDDTVSKA